MSPTTWGWLVLAFPLVGTLRCLAAMVVLPQIGINLAGGILAVLFAFLFVTVSSRITGQIGSSANPVSGMTVATLLLTSLMLAAARGAMEKLHRFSRPIRIMPIRSM